MSSHVSTETDLNLETRGEQIRRMAMYVTGEYCLGILLLLFSHPTINVQH